MSLTDDKISQNVTWEWTSRNKIQQKCLPFSSQQRIRNSPMKVTLIYWALITSTALYFNLSVIEYWS